MALIPVRRIGVALATAVVLIRGASAQVDRYELGLRLRAFERALDAEKAPERRRAAMREMEAAVQAFFSMDPRKVATSIDRAAIALAGVEPAADERFARSLQLVFSARLVDPDRAMLPFELSSAYRLADVEAPDGVRLVITIDGAEALTVPGATESLPCRLEMPILGLPPGDHRVTWKLMRGERVLIEREAALSIAKDLDARLQRLAGLEPAETGDDASIDTATLAFLPKLLKKVTKRGEETVLPSARLLADADALAAAVAAKQPFYGPERTGQHWLAVPVGRGAAIVRIQVPVVPAGEKRPIVLALHGAGGSENLFFDGYGDGLVAKLAAERGWFVVAPRSGSIGTGELPKLVDALAARWSIDPQRVVIVGHSMGAMQTVAAACASPKSYRAVAALGGGGAVRSSDALQALPFFVGVGSRDFAREGAKALDERLRELGVQSTFLELPDVEHLSIVQLALPAVFAFFDGALAPKSAATK